MLLQILKIKTLGAIQTFLREVFKNGIIPLISIKSVINYQKIGCVNMKSTDNKKAHSLGGWGLIGVNNLEVSQHDYYTTKYFKSK